MSAFLTISLHRKHVRISIKHRCSSVIQTTSLILRIKNKLNEQIIVLPLLCSSSRNYFRKWVRLPLLRLLFAGINGIKEGLKRALYCLPRRAFPNIFPQTPNFLEFFSLSLIIFIRKPFLVLLALFFQILQMLLPLFDFSRSIQYLLATKLLHL